MNCPKGPLLDGSMVDSRIKDEGSRKEQSVLSDIAAFFTSVRTTIVILCCLAVASILGTIIPQNINLEELRRTASPFYFRIVVILDLHNLYRSWWFIVLLLLLTSNLIGCLFQRLPKIPKEWRGAAEKGSLSFRRSDARPIHEVKGILTESVSKLMNKNPTVVEGGEATQLVWVKQRIFLLGFPLIHIAIIVILIGGLIGLLYGFKGNIQLREGEVGNRFVLYPSGTIATLPFDIAVDSFTLRRYASGQPKEYRSDVVILKDGKEQLKGPIRVNQPMTFQGISLYQANYQVVGVKHVRLSIKGVGGTEEEINVRPGESIPLPGGEFRIKLASLDPGTTPRGAGVEIDVDRAGKQDRVVKVFRNDSDSAKVEDAEIRFLGYEPLYATGLQIGYDPGTVFVWSGCGLLIAGFFLTLFTNLSAVSIRLTQEDGRTKIQVHGRSRKDRAQFRELVEATIRESLGKSSSGD